MSFLGRWESWELGWVGAVVRGAPVSGEDSL